MAANPSPKSQYSRGHVRKLTPIFPALPLSLSDKTWRRPSEIPPIVEEDSAAASATIPREPEQSVSKVLQNYDNTDTAGQDTATPEISQIAKEQDVVPDMTSNGAAEADEVPNHTLQNLTSPYEQQGAETFAQPEPQTVEHVQVNTEIDASDDPLSAATRRVQILDRDSHPSDHEHSSVDPSSISAATDQSSNTGESALETVVDETSYTHQVSPLVHRKSEVAPEPLSNGFSPHSIHDRNGSQSIIPQPPIVVPKSTQLPSLHDHLLSLASTKQFFDTVIYINHPDTSLQPSEHFIHSLVLCRSEVFAKIISDFDPSIHPKVINLYPSRNIFSHAFEAALRFFYSDQVLTTQTLMPQAGFQTRQDKQYTLEYIMSYWFAGVELGLLPIKARAHEMVRDLISWDLAEAVAKEVQELRFAEDNLQNNQDKFEIREIANSLTRLLCQRVFAQLDLATVDLDDTAQPSTIPTRFSILEYPRSNNPALSSMVFGSLPSEQTIPPNPVSIMTAIVTNVSFLDFSIIAEEVAAIYGLPGENFLRQVIGIREGNRDQVINNRSIPNKQRLSNSAAWESAGWREYLDQHGRLSRDRVGFLLPTRNR